MQDPASENKECLCLETYGSNLLGFHGVPNTVLHDLVTCVEREWGPGIAGISQGIYSVISDYSVGVDYTVCFCKSGLINWPRPHKFHPGLVSLEYLGRV